MRDFQLSASLQCAPILQLGTSVRALEQGGIDLLHIDIMDGRFVPNFALNFDLVEALHGFSPLPADVHLMVEQPVEYVRRALDAGAGMVSVHMEADGALDCIGRIRQAGALAGLALSPGTPVSALLPQLPHIDYVQLMGVKPGFAGQSFLEATLEKITQLHQARREWNPALRISVDGGIDAAAGAACLARGADILVTGAKCMFQGEIPLEQEARTFRDALTHTP